MHSSTIYEADGVSTIRGEFDSAYYTRTTPARVLLCESTSPIGTAWPGDLDTSLTWRQGELTGAEGVWWVAMEV